MTSHRTKHSTSGIRTGRNTGIRPLLAVLALLFAVPLARADRGDGRIAGAQCPGERACCAGPIGNPEASCEALAPPGGTEQAAMVFDFNERVRQRSSFLRWPVRSGDAIFFSGIEAHGPRGLWRTGGRARVTRFLGAGLAFEWPTDVRGTLYVIQHGDNAHSLWKSDGTPEGTALVMDFPTVAAGVATTVRSGMAVGRTFFFVGADETHGSELWKSDGTPEGTVLIKDLLPGPGSSMPTGIAGPEPFAAIGDMLVLTPVAGSLAGKLLRSDGTGNGTFLIDVPGSARVVGSLEGCALLRVGSELWRTDGTVAGTFFLAQGGEPIGTLDGRALLKACDGAQGCELWRTDGTPAGTVLVKDINPGPASSDPLVIGRLGASALLAAEDGVHGRELWMTDGTPAGTVFVRDVNPGAASSLPGAVVFETVFYAPPLFSRPLFSADDGAHGRELWRTDGTAAGTALVRDIHPGPGSGAPSWGSPVAGGAVFSASDATHGLELWRSDGTEAGTALVTDLRPGPQGGFLERLASTADEMCFRGDDGVRGVEMWCSDGTRSGTRLVELDAGDESSEIGARVAVGRNLFLVVDDQAGGSGLWRTDGTPESTILLREGHMSDLTRVGDLLLFAHDDAAYGRELWRSDGTVEGTTLVKDIFPGPDSSNLGFLTELGGRLYFAANEANDCLGLWRSDGTAEGTVRIGDHCLTWVGLEGSAPLARVGDRIFFFGGDYALWKSDGTEAGTVLVSSAALWALNSWLTDVGGVLFFLTLDADEEPDFRWALWRSDGTAAGTRIVRRWHVDNPYPVMLQPTAAGDRLFFLSDDGVHGTELWTSDGTEAGTRLVKDINPGPDGSFESCCLVDQPLASLGPTLFFVADDGVRGRELWRSDGTEQGTDMVRDIFPGVGESSLGPGSLAAIDGKLWFAAHDGVRGREVWRSDGTAEGTVLVADVGPGPLNGIRPAFTTLPSAGFTAAGDRVYFTADGSGLFESLNRELWSLSRPAAAVRVTLCHIPPGNPTRARTITVGAAAVAAHLAHGDTLGPCPSPVRPPSGRGR